MDKQTETETHTLTLPSDHTKTILRGRIAVYPSKQIVRETGQRTAGRT